MNNDSSWNTLSNFLTNNNVMSSVIINLLKSNLDKDEVALKLLPFHLNWEKRNKTFILVSNIGRNISNQLVLIKTLEEAIDFFHMEQLTRNI